MAIPIWFAAFALRTKSVAPLLVLAGASLVLIAFLLGYVSWVSSSSFLRWDGSELLVHEGLTRGRVQPQDGLTAMTARVRIGGSTYSSFFLWVLDGDSRPLLRLRVELWPEGELRTILGRIGCAVGDLTKPKAVTTARRIRRQDKQLLPYWMAHLTGLCVITVVVFVFVLAAVL